MNFFGFGDRDVNSDSRVVFRSYVAADVVLGISGHGLLLLARARSRNTAKETAARPAKTLFMSLYVQNLAGREAWRLSNHHLHGFGPAKHTPTNLCPGFLGLGARRLCPSERRLRQSSCNLLKGPEDLVLATRRDHVAHRVGGKHPR